MIFYCDYKDEDEDDEREIKQYEMIKIHNSNIITASKEIKFTLKALKKNL